MGLPEKGGGFQLNKLAKFSFNIDVHEIEHQDEGEREKLIL